MASRVPIRSFSQETCTIDGAVIMKSIRAEPVNELSYSFSTLEHVKSRYVMHTWIFIGQPEGARGDEGGSIFPLAEPHGPIIYDADGKVVGVVEYSIKEGHWAGFYAGISVEEAYNRLP